MGHWYMWTAVLVVVWGCWHLFAGGPAYVHGLLGLANLAMAHWARVRAPSSVYGLGYLAPLVFDWAALLWFVMYLTSIPHHNRYDGVLTRMKVWRLACARTGAVRATIGDWIFGIGAEEMAGFKSDVEWFEGLDDTVVRGSGKTDRGDVDFLLTQFCVSPLLGPNTTGLSLCLGRGFCRCMDRGLFAKAPTSFGECARYTITPRGRMLSAWIQSSRRPVTGE